MIIAMLGRQPQISLAEIESVHGADSIKQTGENFAILDIDNKTALSRPLGGAIKLCEILDEISAQNWSQAAKNTTRSIVDFVTNDNTDNKIIIGISAYGFGDLPVQQVTRLGLEAKKLIKQSGRSVRIVPNKQPDLNAAQVLNNQLFSKGYEFNYIRISEKTVIVARTIYIQDIDDYAKRDYGRPKRDAYVGMLPPKLAQIIINLAQPQPDQPLLDPFCGTGVVLQEAALMKFPIIGSDINPKMIDYTHHNLGWLNDTYKLDLPETKLEIADATNHKWPQPLSTVACETYLGQPLSGLPKPEKLNQIISDCNTIITKFLLNLHPQLTPNSRICIAVPCWHINNRFKHLPMLDQLRNLGYNRIRFEHASWENMIYYRPDQIVTRELIVLTII